MKRTLRLVGIILAVLLLIVIILPFVVDVNSFRPKLESELSEALGRQVKIGDLKLSLLSGSVAAEDLSIADDPAFSKAPFLRAKDLKVGVELLPLIFSKTLRITGVTIDEPQIVLLRSASGTWNFSSLGDKSPSKTASAGAAKPPKASASSASSSSTGDVSVSKLKINNGRVSIGKANSTAKPRVYDKVNLEVRDFSFASKFPFLLTANLPGGGTTKLDGTAGPIDPADAAMTPLKARINVSRLDLAASGFVEPSSGISGIADFDGNLISDGKQLQSNGALKADKLKLVPKGSPAGRPVQIKYAVNHNLQRQAGSLTQGDITMGKAVAHLTGNYQTQGDSTLLNMKLIGDALPVDELEAMLPALGVILPSGSSLKGGSLNFNLGLSGPLDRLVTTGPIRLADTRLAGFNLGSKLSAISALSGKQTGSDTTIQNLSTNVHVAPDGTRTDNINLSIPALGQVTGSGAISPGGALNYHMNAILSGGAVTGLSQLAGLGSGGSASIPFFIQGTTSNPAFVPDVQGMVGNRLKNLQGNTPGKSPIDALTGLFGKKKTK